MPARLRGLAPALCLCSATLEVSPDPGKAAVVIGRPGEGRGLQASHVPLHSLQTNRASREFDRVLAGLQVQWAATVKALL